MGKKRVRGGAKTVSFKHLTLPADREGGISGGAGSLKKKNS